MNFKNPYSQNAFLEFITDFIPDFKKDIRAIELASSFKAIKSAQLLGQSSKLNDLYILELTVAGKAERKIYQAKEGFRLMKDYQIYQALAVYRSDDDNWRLSLMQMTPDLNETGNIVTNFSNPRRFSFYLGPDAKTKTPEKFLANKVTDLDDLVGRFNVEVVTKEFFTQYKNLYLNLLKHFSDDFGFKAFSSKNNIQLEIFSKKILGQIVFIYFLQRKGWMGAEKGEHISMGDKNFLRTLFDKSEVSGKNYFNDYLEPIFYDCLNKKPEMAATFYREKFDCQIPFLNGGLFEPLNNYEWKNEYIHIPNVLFSNPGKNGILDIFDLYNFTIDENTPDDQEVSVDPEMLGKVFENLIEDNIRKGQGAYYTPREIVHYMCQQSLINFLNTNTQIKDSRPLLEFFDLEKPRQLGINPKIAQEVEQALTQIKVVDPACGSGAFLIGMLQLIVQVRSMMSFITGGKLSDYQLKKQTIEKCLYGVDIDPGAIDIAKLRFWLSLVVDEDINEIEPLPNLDYKIMQGNSLLEDLVVGDKVIPLNFSGNNKLDKRTKDMKNLFEVDIQAKLFLEESDTLAKKLEELHSEYFTTHDSDKKKTLKSRIDSVEDELIKSKCLEEIRNIESQIKNSIDHKKVFVGTQKMLEIKGVLQNWERNHLRPFFPWRLHFGEVFNCENPGFDVVIANPPYISALEAKKIISENTRKTYKQKFLSANGAYDLYIIFFEQGINLLNENGHLTYISPSKYLSAKYATSLRNQILQYSLLELVDYSKTRIFDSAGVSTILTIIKKGKDERPIKTLRPYLIDNKLLDFKIIYNERSYLEMLPEHIWGFLLSEHFTIVKKIWKQSSLISNFAEINASSTASEAEIFSHFINNKSGINQHKIINTGTIGHITNHWGTKSYRNKGVAITTPYINLEKIGVRRKEMYKKPKLIFSKISHRITATYDKNGEFASTNTNIIYDTKKYRLDFLAAFFNSKLSDFVYKQLFGGLGMFNSFQFQAPQLRLMPIPKYVYNQSDFSKLVDNIFMLFHSTDYLENTDKQEKVKGYEDQIDQMVYKLYDLTPEEIKIVEGIK